MARRSEERDFERYRDHGDPEAMARVFDAVAPKLLLVAGHLARDSGEAEDLVQTTFLEAIRGARGWDGRRPLVPWMLGILSHRALDERRRAGLRETAELGEVADALEPHELAADRELREAIAGAIDALGNPYREVLILRVAHGLEPIEIAHTLGRSPGTVRVQLERGRERLRRALPRGVGLPALLLADAGRGLGVVRAAVLEEAVSGGAALVAPAATAGAASTGAMTMIGGLAMKASVITVGLAGLGFFLWTFLHSRAEHELAPRGSGTRETAIARAPEALAPAAPATEAAAPADSAERRVAAANAPEVALEVRVVFEEDDAPAPDVGVYVRPARPEALGIEARTDGNGIARFPELERGAYRVDLDRWDRDPVAVDLAEERAIELAVPDGTDVEGFVENRLGEGVPGAAVFRVNPAHHDRLQRIATADGLGRFELRDVAPTTAFVARADGYQPSPAGIKRWSAPRPGEGGAAAGKAEVRLVLGALGHALTGRVADGSGNPVAQAQVVLAVEEDTRADGVSRYDRYRESGRPPDLEAFSIRADAHGAFATSEVPEGDVTWFARSALDPDLVAAGAFEVLAGAPNELVIVLGGGASVSGRLADAAGAPFSGVEVVAEWNGSPELGQPEHELGSLLADRSARAAEDGSFRLAGLLPGFHHLRVRLARGEVASERVELAAGEERVWQPVIERGAELAVRLIGPDGELLAGWWLTGGNGRERLRARTDGEGLARFGDVAPREHTLFVYAAEEDERRSGLAVASRSGIVPGPGEHVLRLDRDELPDSGIRGRLLDRRGAPAKGRMTIRSETGLTTVELGADGAFELLGLAARPLSLSCGIDDFGSWEPAPGEVLDVGTLARSDPARLVVELRADDGGPIEDPVVNLVSLDDPRNHDRMERDGGTLVFRSRGFAEGEYVVSVRGADIAPHDERVRLFEGREDHVRVVCSRGVVQVVEIVLPPHPAPRGDRDVDVWILDTDGRELVDERIQARIAGDVLRRTYRLGPGRYLVRVRDDRADGHPWPQEEAELVVPESGDVEVLRVDFGTDRGRYFREEG